MENTERDGVYDKTNPQEIRKSECFDEINHKGYAVYEVHVLSRRKLGGVYGIFLSPQILLVKLFYFYTLYCFDRAKALFNSPCFPKNLL